MSRGWCKNLSELASGFFGFCLKEAEALSAPASLRQKPYKKCPFHLWLGEFRAHAQEASAAAQETETVPLISQSVSQVSNPSKKLDYRRFSCFARGLQQSLAIVH